MLTLSAFVPSEQATLVSVFYQIGIWMSHIDDDGDSAADEQEERALIRVLEKTATKYKDNSLIVGMAKESRRQDTNHKRWAQQSDDAIQMAVEAVNIIKARIPDESVEQFKGACMFVAESVAKAFEEGASTQKKGLLDKILGLFGNREMASERKISPTEDSALTELSQALAKI